MWTDLVAGRRSPRALQGDQCGATSMMTSLDGMVHRGLDDGHGMMDARRVATSSSVMGSSMEGLAR
jgi:hypothetical protein